jgi:hypothetical protein
MTKIYRSSVIMLPTKPYQEGYFHYNECFLGEGGFLTPDANEEKHMMCCYIQVLAEALATNGVIFGGAEPVRWLEPGIGDGSSTAKFIDAIGRVHRAGFIIHGSDYQREFVEAARLNLVRSQNLKVTIAELMVRDAFSGDRLASEPCDFAMLSHFIYHIKNQLDGGQLTPERAEENMSGLIKGVMDSLAENGLALAFHESPASDMFGKIGFHFGSAMNDATERLAKAAEANSKTIVRMPLSSRLYFPDLTVETIDTFKKLDNWRKYQEGTPEASWLKKLLFALHNTGRINGTSVATQGGVRDIAREGGANGNESRLGDLIDYMKTLLMRDELGTYITLRSEMQAILNNPALKPAMNIAFLEVERRLPEIKIRTRQAMHAASA